MIILLIILSAGVLLQAQNKTEFNLGFEGDRWESFVVDNDWIGVYDTTIAVDSVVVVFEDSIWVTKKYIHSELTLTKRESGTYRHWELINGKLQPVVKYKNTGMFEPKKYTVIE